RRRDACRDAGASSFRQWWVRAPCNRTAGGVVHAPFFVSSKVLMDDGIEQKDSTLRRAGAGVFILLPLGGLGCAGNGADRCRRESEPQGTFGFAQSLRL